MTKYNNDEKLALIEKTLSDKKAIDLKTIIIPQDINSLFDIIVIASATSSRHIDTLIDEVIYVFKELNRQTEIAEDKYEITAENKSDSGWKAVAIDNIVVHIFTETARETYQVEQLWRKLLIDNENMTR